MKRGAPKQLIQIGDRQVPLPEGVSVAEWALERVRWQNPRLRAFLGCVQQLDEVLDSNFAILHCSPERLHDIERRVSKVAGLCRGEIAALLDSPSKVPALEEALQAARFSLQSISEGVLADLEKLPEMMHGSNLLPARKLLCVSIGKLHGFLQDTFGNLLAADPRSLHDADYFLSRRFPRDIEEAEWLYSTVHRLESFLHELGKAGVRLLRETSQAVRREKGLPHGAVWSGVDAVLGTLTDDLAPLLRQILALRGIRFDEMEMLDRYSTEIPVRCGQVLEMHQTAQEITGEIMSEGVDGSRAVSLRVRDLTASHEVIGRHLADHLAMLDRMLQDLMAFVPLWLKNIEMRRALMLLKREPGDEEME